MPEASGRCCACCGSVVCGAGWTCAFSPGVGAAMACYFSLAVLCGIMKYGVAPPTQHCKSVESSAMSHFHGLSYDWRLCSPGQLSLSASLLPPRTHDAGGVASIQNKRRSLPLPSARACVRPAASVFHSFLRQPLRRLLSCALMTDATAVVLCRSMAMARCPCR